MSTKFYTVVNGAKGVLAVTLDYDMVWVDQFEWQPIITTVEKTIDGGQSVRETRTLSDVGRPITLETQDGNGYQKKSTVDSLITFANVLNKQAWIEIITNSITLSKKVRFRHEEGIKFEQYLKRGGNPVTTSWYQGTIPLEMI